MAKLERAGFGTKLGVILIMIYIFCVLLLGIPCMISEFIIGRHGQSNTARAYRKMAGGTAWSLIGYMSVLTGFLITGYYAVVSGWCLEYVWASLLGKLQGEPAYITQYFTTFSQTPMKPIFWTLVILLASYLIVENGVGLQSS